MITITSTLIELVIDQKKFTSHYNEFWVGGYLSAVDNGDYEDEIVVISDLCIKDPSLIIHIVDCYNRTKEVNSAYLGWKRLIDILKDRSPELKRKFEVYETFS